MTLSRSSDHTLRSGDDLAEAGLIDPGAIDAADAVARRYPVAITPHLAASIEAPGDPLARQFVPDIAELSRSAAERDDPIGDRAFTPVTGVVHRHRDRVLLKPVMTCPVYCRFCFRREDVGGGAAMLSAGELDSAIAYIQSDTGIWEVILTGGDPLVLSDRRIADLLDRLTAIEHVGVIRIHTRYPIADPARITPALADILDRDKPIYVVLHCNHPRELTDDVVAACRRLTRRGSPLLSQTVRLKDVTDNVATLDALLRALVANRIKPYYLHHPDLAPGTGHFRVSVADGQALMRELRRTASGMCLPTYVLDIPGGHGKVPIGAAYIEAGDNGAVRDLNGRVHAYAGVSREPDKTPRPMANRTPDFAEEGG